ncbi:hypothetical protein QJQ45_012559, partial [Haematococcus lacustris]
LDQLLPRHSALTPQDLEWAVRQGAAMERGAAAGSLPEALRALLRHLAAPVLGAGQPGPRGAALQGPGLGPLRVLLLVGLAAPQPSDAAWLTAALYRLNSMPGRSGYLTFEELGEALGQLADGGGYDPVTNDQRSPYGQLERRGVPEPLWDRASSASPLRYRPDYGGRSGGGGGGGESWSGANPGLRHSTGDLAQAMQAMQSRPGPVSPPFHPPPGGWVSPGYPPSPRHQDAMSPRQPAAHSSGQQWGQTGPSPAAMSWPGPGQHPPWPSNPPWGWASEAAPPGQPYQGTGVGMGWGPESYFGSWGGVGPEAGGAVGGWGSQGPAVAAEAEARAAGSAYFLWTHEHRQKILEKYFEEDHARKVKVLEEQQHKLDAQVALKKQSLAGCDRLPRPPGTTLSPPHPVASLAQWPAELQKDGGASALVQGFGPHQQNKDRIVQHARATEQQQQQQQQLVGWPLVSCGPAPHSPCRSPPFAAAQEMRKVEMGLSSLAKQVEKNAYELTGLPPVSTLTVDQLGARIGAALEEAVKISRKKAMLEEVAVNPAVYRPPPSFEKLMDELTSADWLARMAFPANLETLKLALEVRRNGLELTRVRNLQLHDAARALHDVDHAKRNAEHAMGVQAQLLEGRLMQQAAELQRRLLADAHAAAAAASAVSEQLQRRAPPGSPSAHAASSSGSARLQLSPSTWQMEPHDMYPSVSGMLAASFAPGAPGAPMLQPAPTSD